MTGANSKGVLRWETRFEAESVPRSRYEMCVPPALNVQGHPSGIVQDLQDRHSQQHDCGCPRFDGNVSVIFVLAPP